MKLRLLSENENSCRRVLRLNFDDCVNSEFRFYRTLYGHFSLAEIDVYEDTHIGR